MKNLIIFRNKFEIARVILDRPKIVIGRSPECDLVLRAPGVAAKHFVLEWFGVGDFDGAQAKWMLIDISKDTTVAAREGVDVIENVELEMDGFTFKTDKSCLERSGKIGSKIKNQFNSSDRVHSALKKTWSKLFGPKLLREVLRKLLTTPSPTLAG